MNLKWKFLNLKFNTVYQIHLKHPKRYKTIEIISKSNSTTLKFDYSTGERSAMRTQRFSVLRFSHSPRRKHKRTLMTRYKGYYSFLFLSTSLLIRPIYRPTCPRSFAILSGRGRKTVTSNAHYWVSKFAIIRPEVGHVEVDWEFVLISMSIWWFCYKLCFWSDKGCLLCFLEPLITRDCDLTTFRKFSNCQISRNRD